MNEPKCYYTVIPAPVRYSQKLKAIEKIFYSEIVGQCNEQGFCSTTNGYFAELYQVSKNSITGYISSLQKAGFIISEIDLIDGGPRKIYICDLLNLKS
jgi:hypothetical protein